MGFMSRFWRAADTQLSGVDVGLLHDDTQPKVVSGAELSGN